MLIGETVELFYNLPKERAENCNFGNKEKILIMNVIVTNLIDPKWPANSQSAWNVAC